MPIQTTSLETSRKLKEAGFPHDTEFAYSLNTAIGSEYSLHYKPCYRRDFAAPTTDELLAELPCVIVKEIKNKLDVNYWIQIDKTGDEEYCVTYENSQSLLHQIYSKSLPEALASMYLFLAKEGLIGGK